MFRKILIANRGEIAVRINRACREAGIKTVAIYSAVDTEALHVRAADEVCLLASPRGYLAADEIVAIAHKTGAEAIHPGYGFLAESAAFASLCEQHGLIFIGPTPATLNLAGNKALTRELAMKAGVPVIPGSIKEIDGGKEAEDIAAGIGYPLLVKAALGGGGRGMRMVHTPGELAGALQGASREAASSFGCGNLYLEKLIIEPRHIEFQVLADRYGHVIYLVERECSIQRRHQKLVEETPSVAITPEMRRKIGAAAVRITQAVNYTGVGTVEFLLDSAGNFYFIEMNARLQVEHGITELVTGIDLVKEQLRIAAGLPLNHIQEEPSWQGWAIECRLNAEDPSRGFLPCPGQITTYLPPGGYGVRLDSAAYHGYQIPFNYDSMFGKLMAWGNNRGEAIKRMQRALAEFTVEGIPTTIPFSSWVLAHPLFQRGAISTSFIDKQWIEQQQKDWTA